MIKRLRSSSKEIQIIKETVKGMPIPKSCDNCFWKSMPTIKDAKVKCLNKDAIVLKNKTWLCYSYVNYKCIKHRGNP